MNQFDPENEMSEFDPKKFENAEFESAQFEAALALAMQHVDPPEGFADRVLAKAAPPVRGKLLMMPRRVQVWAGGAVAAALIFGAFGIQQQRERKERAEQAARAQQQYEQALQITGETLDHVRAQVLQAGIQLGD